MVPERQFSGFFAGSRALEFRWKGNIRAPRARLILALRPSVVLHS